MDTRKADRATPDWLAAAIAGIAAGAAATLVQLGLWWAASLPALDMLLRDARLAAAIVMGRGVLPPPASFDWTVMLVATLVHFALSAAYGLLLAPLIAGAKPFIAVMIGLLFGLILFGTNMYAFTLLFPWFEASRDWITAATHAAFGVIIAVTYKWSERRPWQ
ncbi:sodium:proline symporter [Herbaspirillum sp. HC18]|nr:sodium:proline symporter [Herbaspirillum sp. HC18]